MRFALLVVLVAALAPSATASHLNRTSAQAEWHLERLYGASATCRYDTKLGFPPGKIFRCRQGRARYILVACREAVRCPWGWYIVTLRGATRAAPPLVLR